jgi:8-oxo-dGTP diphosphatase
MMNETEFYASLPRKRMGAGALFFNQEGALLLVKPTYRDYWLLPGGAIEENESPFQACIREVHEELGLAFALGRLLCLDYVSRQGMVTESLQFIFSGGVLTEAQIGAIRLPQDELSEFRFVGWTEAIALVSPRMSKRIEYCLQALEKKTAIYLEEGQPI